MLQAVTEYTKSTGLIQMTPAHGVMIVTALILMFLAICKKYEPMLLIPISFGALLTNIPATGLMSPPHGHEIGGLFWYLYHGVKLEIFPPLIFMGIGALTDFGPLLARPKTLFLGAAAQLGIFATLLGAFALGFSPREAASIGIIGGADGPTSIFITALLAPKLLAPIVVAAYSYMALVPIIQPPIMKLLTTRKERAIVMSDLRSVSRREKILFPIIVTLVCLLIVPSSAALIGMLMFGNLLRESGIVERLSRSVQNEMINIITVLLGLSVGMTMTVEFLRLETIKIFILGIAAFSIATASGVLLAKIMNLFSSSKINPLIGAAGVSAVPMAARIVHIVGQEENPNNYLLMHAMGPNVAGVIGTAVAAGVLISMLT